MMSKDLGVLSEVLLFVSKRVKIRHKKVSISLPDVGVMTGQQELVCLSVCLSEASFTFALDRMNETRDEPTNEGVLNRDYWTCLYFLEKPSNQYNEMKKNIGMKLSRIKIADRSEPRSLMKVGYCIQYSLIPHPKKRLVALGRDVGTVKDEPCDNVT